MAKRQGGVFCPYLFTRFVRPLISAISQNKLGRNVCDLFVNLFAGILGGEFKLFGGNPPQIKPG